MLQIIKNSTFLLILVFFICISFSQKLQAASQPNPYFDVSKTIRTVKTYVSLNSEGSVANGNIYLIKFNACYQDNTCRYLGPKQWYSHKELTDRRFQERWDVFFSVAGDAGAAVGTAAVTFVGWGVLFGGIGEIPAIVGLGTGSAGGAIVFDALNPYEQWQQQHTLSDDYLLGKKNVILTVQELTDFITRLETVLSKMR